MESRDYLEMTFRSINCFADDGKLSAAELGEILAIAERDGVIDSNEIRVLHRIISKVKPHEIDEPMRATLQRVSERISRK